MGKAGLSVTRPVDPFSGLPTRLVYNHGSYFGRTVDATYAGSSPAINAYTVLARREINPVDGVPVAEAAAVQNVLLAGHLPSATGITDTSTLEAARR